MPTILDDPGVDFASWSDEKLSWLVDRIAAAPAGAVVIRKKLASLPPVPEGRVVTEEPIRDGLVLRLQYVPCGKARCRKDPDEHGPYWYSYYLVNGRWKREYHGRNRPPAEAFWTIEQAEGIISVVPEGQSLDDQQVTMLETVANAMAAMSEDSRAVTLERRARRRVAAERERRDHWIRQRYEELASRRDDGAKLTDDERAELSRLGRILAEDH
jgi:hypothetical protein